jgi:hypothetical protein
MKNIQWKHACLRVLPVLVAMCCISSVFAQDKWDKVIDLQRKWKFSIGDKAAWSSPSMDDSDWEEIYVPSKWEDEGFNGYNGYAWYRTSFQGAELKTKAQGFNLFLGYIDDVDEVYFNGHRVGSSGSFPPRYHTSYDAFRNYYIDASLLNLKGKNVIAVRVFDAGIEGGIVSGDVGIFVNRSEAGLAVNLRGMWDFRIQGMKRDKSGLDAKLVGELAGVSEGWTSMPVPSFWEKQGFPDHDGTAWYRKKFTIPKQYANEDLVLILGKIDDSDRTYLNGKQVGAMTDRHDQLRFYFLKPGDYKTGSDANTLLVLVDDPQGLGGIYEGPVGLMKQSEFTRFMRWR